MNGMHAQKDDPLRLRSMVSRRDDPCRPEVEKRRSVGGPKEVADRLEELFLIHP
jgi:hypothetical protein